MTKFHGVLPGTQERSPCVVKDQITKFVYDLPQIKPTIKELKKTKDTFLHLYVYSKRITSPEMCTKQVHLHQVERRHFDIG
jgi:hypothetical protein